MAVAETLCNLALAKLVHKDRINSLAAPALPLERHFALIYPHYRDAELSRHPWRFANARWELVQREGTVLELCHCSCPGYSYVYDFPGDMLKPKRNDCSDWIVMGRSIVSMTPDAVIVEGTRRVEEALFDPLFCDVMVWRLARETADWPGVTEGKRVEMARGYDEAVTTAQRENAFLREPQTTEGQDTLFSWIAARAV